MTSSSSSLAPAEPVGLLVVDDEPQLLRLMERIFRRQGFRVVSAGTTAEASRLFDFHRDEITAVVLDVILPPEGVEPLLSRLLCMREDLRVVLTSGDELPAALRARLDALGGVFLRKPFSPSEARRAVSRAIDGSGREPGTGRVG